MAKCWPKSAVADDAISAFEKGIEVAEGRGDIQAAKEMKVFLKRLARKSAD